MKNIHKNKIKHLKSHLSKKNISVILNKARSHALLVGIVGSSFLSLKQATAFPANFNLNQLNGANGFSLSDFTSNAELAGFSVNLIKDVNGDGIDDIIIGAPRTSGSILPNQPGEAYLIFGKAGAAPFPVNFDLSTLNGQNGCKFVSFEEWELAGFSVGGGGDVNGDGFNDILIGAPGTPGLLGTYTPYGVTYVIYGHAGAFPAVFPLNTIDGINGARLTGEPYDHSGRSVNIAGDVNGDGLDDIIIGGDFAYNYNGKAYVVFGNTNGLDENFPLGSMAGILGFQIQGSAPQGGLGWSVSGAGDLNNDGFDDIIAGAPFCEPFNNIINGESYVYFGHQPPFLPLIEAPQDLNGANGFMLWDSSNVDQFFGFSVGGLGDINGDGIDDIASGATLEGAGYAYILFGAGAFNPIFDGNLLNGANGFTIEGLSADDRHGFSLHSAGDLNGDGLQDIVVGSKGSTFTQTAQANVVFGSKNFPNNIKVNALNGVNGFQITGPNNEGLGQAVSGGKDINGDGIDDIIIGAPYSNFNGPDTGRAYVIYGAATPPEDFNGDQQADLIIQYGMRVIAAFMTNGTYTGVKKTLFAFNNNDPQQVVAVNDFNNDNQPDLVTQAGQTVKILTGPNFNIWTTINLPQGMEVVASGNTKGQQHLPEIITRQKNFLGSSFYAHENFGNGMFSAPQIIYSYIPGKNDYLADVGHFLGIQKSSDAIFKVNTQVVARSVTNLNGSSTLITMLPNSSILGAADFVQTPYLGGKMEVISTNGTQVIVGTKASGYILNPGERVAGPK